LLNRTPNKKLEDRTPYEAVTGRKPDMMKHCVPVGSTGYALITDEEQPNRHKMDPRAQEAELLGYPEDVNGSYLVKTKTGRLLIRRDVKFNDFDFDNQKLTEEEMKIIYDEETWNQYAYPVRNFEDVNEDGEDLYIEESEQVV
jgi:hypothetical protein